MFDRQISDGRSYDSNENFGRSYYMTTNSVVHDDGRAEKGRPC